MSGIMEASTQQLGLGMILSTLLITVPPMAGMWFNGVMGRFSPYTPFNNANGGRQALPPGMGGGQSYQQQVGSNVLQQMYESVRKTAGNQILL